MENENISNILNMVFSDYIKDANEDVKNVPKFSAMLTDNLYNAALLHVDSLEKTLYEKMSSEEIGDMNNLNGCMLVPNSKSEHYLILINTMQVDDNNSFIYTFAHELTHVFDFSKYIHDNNISTEKELTASKDYCLIYYWSEFHARYYSNKYARRYFNISKEETLKTIAEQEFPLHMKNLNKCLENFMCGGVKVLTELMYQYGRFISYKEYGFIAIEQYEFPKDKIIEMFGCPGIEIYYMFENIMDYRDFNLNIIKIRNLLKKIEIGFDSFRFNNPR